MKSEIRGKADTHDYFILMADIIASRTKDQKSLMSDFKEITAVITEKRKTWFLSPITITLGDEFQCVIKDLKKSIQLLLDIEEEIIRGKKDFKLRYVLLEGEINTPLNPKVAYEMLGPGLTRAREKLNAGKTEANRFLLEIKNKKRNKELNSAFEVYQSFVDDWRVEKDYYIVAEYIDEDDYSKVAKTLSKNPSLMWKRKNSLKIKPYKAIKHLITSLVEDIP